MVKKIVGEPKDYTYIPHGGGGYEYSEEAYWWYQSWLNLLQPDCANPIACFRMVFSRHDNEAACLIIRQLANSFLAFVSLASVSPDFVVEGAR